MKSVSKTMFLMIAMAAITACGGSDSGQGVGEASASVSLAPTAVSNDGQVVAVTVFSGGVQSNHTAPTKSIAVAIPSTAIQRIAVNMLAQRISQKMSQAKTITTTVNPQNTAGTIKFVDEKISVGGGHITFNGEINAEKIDDLNAVGEGTLTAQQEGVDIRFSRNGATYSEVVNGTVTLELSLTSTFTQGASGQINGVKTVGDVILKGSDIIVSGDVSGKVTSMNGKYRYEILEGASGTTLVSESCSGYLSISMNGEQAVCGMLSSCDGCEQPNL